MAPIPPFAVEQWMDEHETKCKYNIAETCCASISLNQLVELSENKATKPSDLIDPSAVLDYGEIRGSTELRTNLSRLYSSKVGTPLPPDNVLITPGAISANHLVLYGLVGRGDHAICHYPTYQQLYSVPESLGAEVSLWKSKPENKWLPDFEELKSLIKENTKLLILNNPQNPTGAVLPKSLLEKIIELCEAKGIAILSDEVYRPLFHGITPMDKDFPSSIISMGYNKTIVTGSLSKAYSLAGIRVGWVATRSPEILAELAKTRDYTTISVSKLDQAVAAFALSADTIHALLSRNIQLAKANLELLEKFIIKHDEFCSVSKPRLNPSASETWDTNSSPHSKWTKPVAGTTAFVKFERDGNPVNAEAFCKDVQEKTGVMLLPGDVGFGENFKGYVRFGYANKTEILKDALEELRKYMRKEFDDVPLSD